MEHLFLEVAAAPLRLLAAKNEKSRSELGRFLAKQVKEGGRGKLPGRPRPPPSRVPCSPERDALLLREESSGVLSPWTPPQGWPGAETSARV